MFDNALTGSFPGNSESPEDVRRRIDLAVTLIRLAEQTRTGPAVSIIKWYLRCARQAAEAGVSPIPAAVTVDAAVRRALEFFGLSPAQAVRVADDRRRELIDALRATPSGNDVVLPGKASYKQLADITSLLTDLAWFTGKVKDGELAGQLQTWVDLRDQLRPGPEVAQYTSARMQARLHTG
jgi:hypothetical protein